MGNLTHAMPPDRLYPAYRWTTRTHHFSDGPTGVSPVSGEMNLHSEGGRSWLGDGPPSFFRVSLNAQDPRESALLPARLNFHKSMGWPGFRAGCTQRPPLRPVDPEAGGRPTDPWPAFSDRFGTASMAEVDAFVPLVRDGGPNHWPGRGALDSSQLRTVSSPSTGQWPSPVSRCHGGIGSTLWPRWSIVPYHAKTA
jgi:hypothetical protein